MKYYRVTYCPPIPSLQGYASAAVIYHANKLSNDALVNSCYLIIPPYNNWNVEEFDQ